MQGEEEVLYWLEEAFERFPGLVFDSHARHVGYGQVIEEARVRDIGPLNSDDAGRRPTESADDGSDAAGGPRADVRVLWSATATSAGASSERLNMPIRLTVMHDDAYVHEIIASYPRALLRSALGLHVDPLDKAVSEIQSAFVAPAGSGFKTYELGSKRHIETEYAQAAPVPLARIPEPEPELEHDAEPEPVARRAPTRHGPRRRTSPDEDDEPRRRALLAGPARDGPGRPRSRPAAGGSVATTTPPRPATSRASRASRPEPNKGDDKPTKKPSANSPKPTPTRPRSRSPPRPTSPPSPCQVGPGVRQGQRGALRRRQGGDRQDRRARSARRS